MGLPETQPNPLQMVDKTLSITLKVPAITCLRCQNVGEFVPNSLRRGTYEEPWKLDGWLWPQGWERGLCASCVAVEKAVAAAEKPAEVK